MSWSASVPEALPVPEVYAAIAALEPQGQEIAEATKACVQAKSVAKTLIESGAFGTDVKFRVHLAGHANPDNAPVAGWANDQVTISVSQA